MTWVNQIHYGYDELPFGGLKESGLGKEHGHRGDARPLLRDEIRRRRRAGLMAVSFSTDAGIGIDHARQAAGELVRPRRSSRSSRTPFDEAADDDDVKVVVVRSASERFFSAGADIKAFHGEHRRARTWR